MLQEFLVRHRIKDKNLAIAVSGGADSLALALLAKEELSVYGYKITALTVDHGLRPSSSAEAEYVSKVMKEHGIEHHILCWQGEKPSVGVEEAARAARYALLKEKCVALGICVLLTAHHLYDQAETFFMRLQRGSGLQGLCAIRPVTNYEGLKIVRPLLDTPPSVMKVYLKKRGIKWVEDESNSDTRYLRNKIRAFMPQLFAGTGITPQRTGEAVRNLQSADDFIESCVSKLFAAEITRYGAEVYCFAYKNYLKWHGELKFRVISKLCGKGYVPRADSVTAVIKALDMNPLCGMTLGGREIFTAYGKVWVVPEMLAKHRSSRKEWKEFSEVNPQYNNLKIPHKARLAILKEKA